MPTTKALSFTDLLRLYRRRSKLTQEELAERAGLSRGAVSLLERGVTQAPQRATVDMLSSALALSTDEAIAFLDTARQLRPADEDEHATVEPSPLHTLPALDGDLPVPLTPLIGRAQEQVVALDILGHETTRLLTLTGPAGVGKTRFALELATTVQRERHREVVFVGLITVQEPDRVLPTIAQALEVRETDHVSLQAAIHHALLGRSILLVLDNFEQVLPAARDVLELLIARPNVKALVTSRSPLNVRGERSYPVAPLALPNATQLKALDQLRQVPTIELFLDRATATLPDFTLQTLEDGFLVAAICARLDGLPLAIELAAARLRHFGLRQLHERLAEPTFLGMLTDGPQDLADHQRTMQSTITWSYDLLGADERRLFRWLGVFIGGATLEAMAAVTGTPEDALLTRVIALIVANLLQATDTGGAPRYTQLMTLHAYAEKCLHACAEWEDARQRHAAYCYEVALASFESDWDNRELATAQVEQEYENIRAALSWAWETGETWLGLRTAAKLRRFWDHHSYFLEGLDWLQRFIGRTGAPQSQDELVALADAWTGVLVMAHRLDRFEQARDAGEVALQLRREVGDKVQIAGAMMNLANPISQMRDFGRARTLYEECIALHREINNPAGLVFAYLNLGDTYAAMGEPRTALEQYEQSLALSREMGESDFARGLTWNSVGEACLLLDDPTRAIEVVEPIYQLFVGEHAEYFAATCAFTLGRAHWRLREREQARTYLDTAEQIFRKLGNVNTVARILGVRSSVCLQMQDMSAACRDLSQALADMSDLARDQQGVWTLIESGGALALRLHMPEHAARLYGAAIAHRNSPPGLLEPAERDLRERDIESLRVDLGEAEYARLVAEGKSLNLGAAISNLRQVLEKNVPTRLSKL
jgi:predicted ATPase/transcriptional regulator with XRE-family HTH domain